MHLVTGMLHHSKSEESGSAQIPLAVGPARHSLYNPGLSRIQPLTPRVSCLHG